MPAPVMAPGRGPCGPAAVKASRPITSVGIGTSSVPYGAFGSFAASTNGVWGYVGPAASSLQQPTTWYVRATGSNNNGGTSTAAAGDRTGSDGVTNGTTTFTSASAAFTSADVGAGICINTGANARHHRIVSVTNATTVILDRTSSNASSLAWVIGGAWADYRVPLGDSNVNADSNSAVRAGDSVYIGAGTYRVVAAMSLTPGFNGQVNIIGDVDGARTGDPGMVRLTPFLTNDKTAASGAALLNLNGKSNVAFSNLFFDGATASPMLNLATATCQNVTFTNCAVNRSGAQQTNVWYLQILVGFGVFANFLMDRCVVRHSGTTTNLIQIGTKATGAEWDSAITFRNSLFFGSHDIFNVQNSGGLTVKGGGVNVTNCAILSCGSCVQTASATSTIFPVRINNCHIVCPSNATAMTANASGQIVEDYNLIQAEFVRTNVATGAHSISDGSYAMMWHFGQERVWGGNPRWLGEPMSGSPLLGWGSANPGLPVDLTGRPRPAGGASPLTAVGPLERSNSFVKETGTVQAGSNAISITGPGYQEFDVPVDASSTSISVYMRRDSGYAGTLPQLQLDANGAIGVAAQLVTDTGAVNTYNLVALAAFTPTAAGIVKLRVISNDLSGAGLVYVDTFAIS